MGYSSYFCGKKPHMSQYHRLKVNSIKRETNEAVSVGFEVPENLKDKFQFVAGQYLTLEKEIAGKNIRRSYSICSSPKEDHLKVAVKQIANGKFSTWVNNKLQVGDEMNVFLPEGRFIHQPNSATEGKTYIAFAAGSGITPIMSILQSILTSEKNSKFVLVYGNKTPEQTIFYNDLIALKNNYSDRFYIDFVYSRLKKEAAVLKFLKKSLFRKKEENPKTKDAILGRIEKNTVDYIVNGKFKTHNFDEYYLCGPQEMTSMIAEYLENKGVDENRIHYELFVTETAEEMEIDTKDEGKTKITVILDDEEVTFEMDKKTRVLDAIMEEDLDPPYSCQGGICSSCLAQIHEGKAKMAVNQILTEEEVEDGLVLTCQAHPTTDTLVVDYDDI